MADKVIYFTAGEKPTTEELADIAKLNAVAAQGYVVNVSNSTVDSGLGTIEACDYVAGTVPDDYSEVPVFDVDSPPIPNLPATAAVVYDAEALTVTVTGTYVDTATFTVVDNAITEIVLS